MAPEAIEKILVEYPFYNLPKVAKILELNKMAGDKLEEINYFGFESPKLIQYAEIYSQFDINTYINEVELNEVTTESPSLVIENNSPNFNDIHVEIAEANSIEIQEPIIAENNTILDTNLPKNESTNTTIFEIGDINEVQKIELEETPIEFNFKTKEQIDNFEFNLPKEIEETPIIKTNYIDLGGFQNIPSTESTTIDFIQFANKIEAKLEDNDSIILNEIEKNPPLEIEEEYKSESIKEELYLEKKPIDQNRKPSLENIFLDNIIQYTDIKVDADLIEFQSKKTVKLEEIIEPTEIDQNDKIESVESEVFSGIEEPKIVEPFFIDETIDINTSFSTNEIVEPKIELESTNLNKEEIETTELSEVENNANDQDFNAWLNNFSRSTKPTLNIADKKNNNTDELNQNIAISQIENTILEDSKLESNLKIAKDDDLEKILQDEFYLSQLKSKKGSKTLPVDNRIQDEANQSLISTDLYSETIAVLYANQGNKQKAIEVYENLILKFPEKSSFFAVQIENLKNK